MCLEEGRGSSKPADDPTIHHRVQTLFDACKETFSASFSNRSLDRVRTLLGIYPFSRSLSHDGFMPLKFLTFMKEKPLLCYVFFF